MVNSSALLSPKCLQFQNPECAGMLMMYAERGNTLENERSEMMTKTHKPDCFQL